MKSDDTLGCGTFVLFYTIMIPLGLCCALLTCVAGALGGQ